MEFLTAVLGLVPCFYDHTSKHTLYIRHLKKNLRELSKEMKALNNLYKDVKTKVESEEDRQMVRTNQVDGWISEAEGMEKEVREILQRGDQEIQKRCLGCCPMNCWSSYKIGKEVSEKLVDVSVLIGRGNNIQVVGVAEMLPLPLVDELPMEETVGPELAYDTACEFLKDRQMGIMGLYGMGGVGKTHLLTKINNDFLATSNDFEVVIWAEVSQSPDIAKIQENVSKKLQIPRNRWETKSSQKEKAAEILRVLRKKRFVLLLDDIWERLDLLEIGFPHPDAENKSKIVFTTRSPAVCRQMTADRKIEVACLSWEAAWSLFKKKVGEKTLDSHPHIPRLAQVVAKACKGLPLALITLGRALVDEKDPSAWDKVIQDLSKFPAEISGMEVELFRRLRVSYDRLSDDVIKSCFLYCSLHPEDEAITCELLIDLWIGEGFLGEVHDMHEARNQGHKIIRKLKDACLLESSGLKERKVKMHDVIRDMALWLYSECGKERNKILVYKGVSGKKEAQEITCLKETEKMSIWNRNVEQFPETMESFNLKTLILNRCHQLKELSSGFFQFMPLIRVLDLSYNDDLIELPIEISKLVALQYLDLSFTKIRELPIELTNLKNLMTFGLNGMESLEIIPRELVSSLISLKSFSICRTNVPRVVEESLLHELESLNGISEIFISMSTTISLNKLKSSHKLLRCVNYLRLSNYEDLISLELSSSILKRLEHLQWLVIVYCNEFKDIKIEGEQDGAQKNVTLPNNVLARENHFRTLRNVFIHNCPKLLNLTWLAYAPYLEQLYVCDCESMEHVICFYGAEENLDVFSRLKYLNLGKLPGLKSICQHLLPFPSIEIIKVYNCKSLRSLPFNFNPSTSNLKKIKGGTRWWNQLEWSDDTIKHAFTPYFQINQGEAYDTDSKESESGESEASDKDDKPEQLMPN